MWWVMKQIHKMKQIHHMTKVLNDIFNNPGIYKEDSDIELAIGNFKYFPAIILNGLPKNSRYVVWLALIGLIETAIITYKED